MSLPRIYAGRRRVLLWRLVLNGFAQGSVAYALAHLLRRALASTHPGSVPWALVAGVAASGLLTLALRAAEAADAERLGQDYVMRVRLRIFDAVARRSVQAGRRRWGVTMTRLISDLSSLKNWVSHGVARSLVASITIAGLAIALAQSHGIAVIAVGLMVGLSGALAALLFPVLRSQVREARRRRGRLANNLGEKILAAGTVRQFGNTDSELRRVRTHSRWLRDALVRRMRTAQLLRSLPHTTAPFAIGVLVVLAAHSTAIASDLAVAVLLIGMVGNSLSDLARALDYRLSFEEGRQRIQEILSGPRLKESRSAVDLSAEGPLSLHFGKVTVRGRCSVGPFSVEPGRTALVTGDAGSGKSTVLALAARLFDPDSGAIELGGIPLRRVSLASLRSAVQLVTPDLPLLRGSLGDNLSYGAEEADEGWIGEVMATCGLDGEPLLRDSGLETRIEEQGRNLPEGLRARISLARAAIASPGLLLIDHPVLVFDPTGREALRAVIELLSTTVLIAAPARLPSIPTHQIWRLSASDSRQVRVA